MELPCEQFWQSTPRQIAASLRARNAILIQRRNEMAWLAWHIGMLSKPLKKYPSLESLKVKDAGQKPVRQSWEQQLAIARMWAAKGGGKITRKN